MCCGNSSPPAAAWKRGVALLISYLVAGAGLGLLAGCAPIPPERVFAAAQTTGERSGLKPPTRLEDGIVYAWAPCPGFADDWRMGIVPMVEGDRFPGEQPVFVVAHLVRRAGQLVSFVYRAPGGEVCRQAGVQNTLRQRSVYLADRFVPAEAPGYLPGSDYTVEVTCAGEVLGTTAFRVE
jgi:hypothetical protein